MQYGFLTYTSSSLDIATHPTGMLFMEVQRSYLTSTPGQFE